MKEIFENSIRQNWLRSLKEGDKVQILHPLIPDTIFGEVNKEARQTLLQKDCLVMGVDEEYIYVNFYARQKFKKFNGLREDDYSAIFP